MDKKIAIVTGGTRGIGLAATIALANSGFLVIANYKKNKERAKEIESKNNNIKTLQFDASNSEETEDKINHITKTYGPISILINNAGITKDKFAHKMSIEDWQSVLNTNLNSTFHCTRSILPNMRKQNFGRIISISSSI